MVVCTSLLTPSRITCGDLCLRFTPPRIHTFTPPRSTCGGPLLLVIRSASLKVTCKSCLAPPCSSVSISSLAQTPQSRRHHYSGVTRILQPICCIGSTSLGHRVTGNHIIHHTTSSITRLHLTRELMLRRSISIKQRFWYYLLPQ